MYNIGEIVTVTNNVLDEGDEKYVNKTGIIQEIDRKEQSVLYGVRFNAFSSHVERSFYENQLRPASEYEMSCNYKNIMNTYMN